MKKIAKKLCRNSEKFARVEFENSFADFDNFTEIFKSIITEHTKNPLEKHTVFKFVPDDKQKYDFTVYQMFEREFTDVYKFFGSNPELYTLGNGDKVKVYSEYYFTTTRELARWSGYKEYNSVELEKAIRAMLARDNRENNPETSIENNN